MTTSDTESSGTASSGSFQRDSNYITTRITADGRDGFPVEPGRYRLVVARACPWANRAIIVRRLLGLEDALSMGICGPTHDERSWTFDLDPGGRDPVLGIERLQEAFFARDPHYPRGITVPAIVDIPTGAVVTNGYPQITLDLSTEWTAYHRAGAPDLYPGPLREEIDEVGRLVYEDVNNGVYKAGLATSQRAYDRAYTALFDRLDWLSDRLHDRRYLVGNTITEADVRLFTTLARFDAVYHGHFKCNRQKLTELPVLWAYARDLFQTPGFGDTTDFVQIKQHYYYVHRAINPSGVVPDGPDLTGWLTPHGREQLGGSPFGDGTPPGPVRESERVPTAHGAARTAGADCGVGTSGGRTSVPGVGRECRRSFPSVGAGVSRWSGALVRPDREEHTMVDFDGLKDKAEDAASDHADQVDGGLDKAADAAGDRFGHSDQIGQGADKLEDMIPGEGNQQ